MWGFRAPLGAFISAWGGVAMITSAPFDNWWHNAYGIDVKILSPPHAVLALGMFATVFGALILVLREQNLGAPDRPAPVGFGSRMTRRPFSSIAVSVTLKPLRARAAGATLQSSKTV